MLVCPRCEKKMGRDHHCSLPTRRYFLFGALAATAVAVKTALSPPNPLEICYWVPKDPSRLVDSIERFKFDDDSKLWMQEFTATIQVCSSPDVGR